MRNERSLTIWSDHGNTFPGNAVGAVGLVVVTTNPLSTKVSQEKSTGRISSNLAAIEGLSAKSRNGGNGIRR